MIQLGILISFNEWNESKCCFNKKKKKMEIVKIRETDEIGKQYRNVRTWKTLSNFQVHGYICLVKLQNFEKHI